MYGADSDLRETLKTLQHEVARAPADSAMLRLLGERAERGTLDEERSRSDRLALGMASFTGFVLHNGRIRGCTELLLRAE